MDQLLKPEVQESLTTLVEQLPKLTELVNILTKSYDFAQSVATDEVLKNDTVGAITEIATPVVDSVKGLAATAIEAKDRADANNEVIGLFGLIKNDERSSKHKSFSVLLMHFFKSLQNVTVKNNFIYIQSVRTGDKLCQNILSS